MKKVKTTKEVEAVQITQDEFARIASEECTEMFLAMTTDDEDDMDCVIIPMVCAKFAAHLMARIFADNNEENEEREEKENAQIWSK